jgi:hypothetical protein
MSRFPDEALHKHFNRVYGIDDNQEAGSRDLGLRGTALHTHAGSTQPVLYCQQGYNDLKSTQMILHE